MNTTTQKLSFDSIRDYFGINSMPIRNTRRKTSSNCSTQENLEILKKDPIYEYAEFVIDGVCEVMDINKNLILGKRRDASHVLCRYFIIDILCANTDLGYDAVYLVNRDRTVFYNYWEVIAELKNSHSEIYNTCETVCSMSSFNRFKQEETKLNELIK